MRCAILLLWILLGGMTPALAQLSVGIGFPGVSIGIDLPRYPRLVRVPDYPVYYAPGLDSNFFFYDGMYWVYQSDNWYTSDWYNGPWGLVGLESVPVFVLRIPVRYYRNPPVYFGGWRGDAPPRWGEHWGNDWARRHAGWDRWNRASVPAIAPLPVYQRRYPGDRYPRAEQQRVLRGQNYRYLPREAVARQQFQEHAAPRAPVPPRPNGSQQDQSPREPEARRPSPPPAAQRQPEPAEPRARAPQRGGDEAQRPAPARERERQQPVAPAAQDQNRRPQPGAAERAPQVPRSAPRNAPQGMEPAHEQGRGRGQDEGKNKDRGKGDERGQPGRN